MGAIVYNATRNLRAGVVSGSEQSMYPEFGAWLPSSVRVGKENVSLDGTREVVLHRIEQRIRISDVYSYDDVAVAVVGDPRWDVIAYSQWNEFFSSVMAGETFTVDRFGEPGRADEVLTVVLSGAPTTRRLSPHHYRSTFNVVVVA